MKNSSMAVGVAGLYFIAGGDVLTFVNPSSFEIPFLLRGLVVVLNSERRWEDFGTDPPMDFLC